MQELIIDLKQRADGIIETLGFEGESIIVQEGRAVIVNYEIDSPALLIGRGGEGLDSLQHIMRLLATDLLMSHDIDLVVDIAGYRSKKAAGLTRMAKDKAYQVLSTGISEIMPPMSAYERRLVHTTCAAIAEIETASEGTGRDRRVVIKPKKS